MIGVSLIDKSLSFLKYSPLNEIPFLHRSSHNSTRHRLYDYSCILDIDTCTADELSLSRSPLTPATCDDVTVLGRLPSSLSPMVLFPQQRVYTTFRPLSFVWLFPHMHLSAFRWVFLFRKSVSHTQFNSPSRFSLIFTPLLENDNVVYDSDVRNHYEVINVVTTVCGLIAWRLVDLSSKLYTRDVMFCKHLDSKQLKFGPGWRRSRNYRNHISFHTNETYLWIYADI